MVSLVLHIVELSLPVGPRTYGMHFLPHLEDLLIQLGPKRDSSFEASIGRSPQYRLSARLLRDYA